MRTTTLLLLAVLTSACVRARTDPVSGQTDIDVESPTKQGEDWRASLTGQGSYTSVVGTANADVLDGQTSTSIQISGATAGAVHPWHVHEGKCGSGAIVGDPSAYTPLTVGTDGRATSTAKVAVALNEAKDYHVNVHLSQAEMSTIIACGDLQD